ncbi:MAG: SAM-dependent methyltransferase [Deltaproteobacteria bacterium CG11_big_fil_rev_8_21_14_0_20_47_16]|nr:MAG: SAM-dependent methyltransferase [Deltaproteobacteria bacterium CG11_big_fil_rev_8_21_14_0_20_47_16]
MLPRELPNWNELYKTIPVEEMPWFSQELDHDLAAQLTQRKLSSGRFLDIGTGPGTQAIALAQRGFTVTATDVSEAAIHRLQQIKTPVTFVQDDILHSTVRGPFDFIFDRGCFHVLDPKDWTNYVRTVHSLLADDGILFLKTFSHHETNVIHGPYRFTPEEIRSALAPHFKIDSIVESEFNGTLKPNPKALFTVAVKTKR